jgi:hypothetical protein
MLKVNKVLEVIINIIKVFASSFIYVENLRTILITRAIITGIILNSKLTSISKLVIAKDFKLTTLAKGTISAIAATKASVFRAFF